MVWFRVRALIKMVEEEINFNAFTLNEFELEVFEISDATWPSYCP